jgi:hypothetical protein
MQALSVTSSYFLLDGDGWRISQNVELRHDHHSEMASGYLVTNFAAENVLMGNDYLYDLGEPEPVDPYRRRISTLAGKEKSQAKMLASFSALASRKHST